MEQLLAELEAKAIDYTTPVWNSGLTDWTPLGNTELNPNWVAQPWQVDPALKSCVWYYLDQSTRQGPVSGQQIFDLLKSSKLKPDSLIWKDGFSDWKPLKQTELGSHTAHILPPCRCLRSATALRGLWPRFLCW